MQLGISIDSLLFILTLCECVNKHITEAGYDLKCPHNSHWHFRQSTLCNISVPEYMCLQDFNSQNYIEVCDREADFQRKGFRSVWRGNLDGQVCSKKRYQPELHFTSDGSDCIYQKSSCNETGQIRINDVSSITDTKCTCDYTLGYAFVSEPSNQCYCIPSQEDCSCFLKRCPYNYQLSQDFQCVRLEDVNGNYNCPIWCYQIQRTSKKKEMVTQKQTESESTETEDTGGVYKPVLQMAVIMAIYMASINVLLVVKSSMRKGVSKCFEKLASPDRVGD